MTQIRAGKATLVELAHKTPSNFFSRSLLLFSLSQCKGSTLTSEDSSEVAFLLVENYQLTASVGLRIGREYLDTLLLSQQLFISFARSCVMRAPGEEQKSPD